MPRRNTRSRGETGGYHVYNRGIDRRLIFLDDKDRQAFVSLLGRFARLHGHHLEIVSFCAMGTHFHLILWQKQPGGLSAFMNSFVPAYVKYFNSRHNRKGPLFSCPYRARRLTTPKNFKWAVVYVHDNHRTGVAHRFSSHAAFVDESQRPGWLAVEPALRIFGGPAAYSKYVEAVAGQSSTGFVKAG
jgi:putative transposase